MGLDLGDLDRFLAEYDVDDNVWWTQSVGQMQNYFDALLARYQELSLKYEQLEEQVENWRDAYAEAKQYEAQREEMFLAELAKSTR
jgi:outer membrane murein-binding lipoprotein Lpp